MTCCLCLLIYVSTFVPMALWLRVCNLTSGSVNVFLPDDNTRKGRRERNLPTMIVFPHLNFSGKEGVF